MGTEGLRQQAARRIDDDRKSNKQQQRQQKRTKKMNFVSEAAGSRLDHWTWPESDSTTGTNVAG